MKKSKQIGNFILKKEKNATGQFVVVKAVSGIWSIRWREDTEMYGYMQNFFNTNCGDAYLHSLITLMYTASTHLHDIVALSKEGTMPFTDGFSELLAQQTRLELKYADKVSDEADAKILKEERESHEVFEELVKLDKDGGDD